MTTRSIIGAWQELSQVFRCPGYSAKLGSMLYLSLDMHLEFCLVLENAETSGGFNEKGPP